MICIDFDKGKLTTKEARRALGEMSETLEKKHIAEVEKKLDEAEADED